MEIKASSGGKKRLALFTKLCKTRTVNGTGQLDLVLREGVERTADAGRVPGRDLGVRAEQRADQDCK